MTEQANKKNPECSAAIRKLIHIPIVHTEDDMGTLGKTVERTAVQQLGVKARRRKRRIVDQLWSEIEQIVESLPITHEKIRLYQDGLPVCGHEIEIVRDLAERGSRNHRLLRHLLEKGAILMGTESPTLLLKEYERLKASAAKNEQLDLPSAPHSEQEDDLLKARNAFIAQRINNTLNPGETGILFLGMLHSLDGLLDPDIHVFCPLAKQITEEKKDGGTHRQASDCR